MQANMLMPRFAGRTERTNPQLADLKPGDKALVVGGLQVKLPDGTVVIKEANAELVTIKSIGGHHGRAAKNEVPPLATVKVPKDAQNDMVDRVTAVDDKGEVQSFLIGSYSTEAGTVTVNTLGIKDGAPDVTPHGRHQSTEAVEQMNFEILPLSTATKILPELLKTNTENTLAEKVVGALMGWVQILENLLNKQGFGEVLDLAREQHQQNTGMADLMKHLK